MKQSWMLSGAVGQKWIHYLITVGLKFLVGPNLFFLFLLLHMGMVYGIMSYNSMLFCTIIIKLSMHVCASFQNMHTKFGYYNIFVSYKRHCPTCWMLQSSGWFVSTCACFVYVRLITVSLSGRWIWPGPKGTCCCVDQQLEADGWYLSPLHQTSSGIHSASDKHVSPTAWWYSLSGSTITVALLTH